MEIGEEWGRGEGRGEEFDERRLREETREGVQVGNSKRRRKEQEFGEKKQRRPRREEEKKGKREDRKAMKRKREEREGKRGLETRFSSEPYVPPLLSSPFLTFSL